MRLERAFHGNDRDAIIRMTIEKGKLEMVVTTGGKEKRHVSGVDRTSFGAYTKLVHKQLKDGLEPVPFADAAKVANDLVAVAEWKIDLSIALDVFTPGEREAIVARALAQADKARRVIGPDDPLRRADLFTKCPTPALLRHFLAGMAGGKISASDLPVFATAISNAAREPKQHAWIIAELDRALPTAEPELKKWLQARIAKLHAQTKVTAQLASPAAKPATTEEALLEEIGAHPDDDAPRLVWADWLLERGLRWGEVVMAQCALAKMAVDDPKRVETHVRANRIDSATIAKFMAPIRPYIVEASYARGLLGKVTVSVDKLLKDGAAQAIILRAPGAQLELKGLKSSHLKALAGLPAGRFGELKISAKVPADALAALLRSPLCAGLRALELWALDAKSAAALAMTPATIRRVTLWDALPIEVALAALAKSAAAPHLQKLRVNGKSLLTRPAVDALRAFPELTELGVKLSATGFGADLARLQKLTDLTVRESFSDEDCAAIAGAPFAKKLERLTITSASFGDTGAKLLLALPNLKGKLALEGKLSAAVKARLKAQS